MHPRIPWKRRCVNPVIRFPVHKKSPRDVSPTSSVAHELGLASLTDPEDDFNGGGLMPPPLKGSDSARSAVSDPALWNRCRRRGQTPAARESDPVHLTNRATTGKVGER